MADMSLMPALTALIAWGQEHFSDVLGQAKRQSRAVTDLQRTTTLQ